MKNQCNEYEFLITLYVDGESEEADKRRVFLHLAECESCRSYWEALTEMKVQAARENRLTTPVTLDARIITRPMQKDPSIKMSRSWKHLIQHRLLVPAPVAILLALFLLSGGAGIALLWPSHPEPAKEIFEPVVYVKLPTVEIRGNVAHPASISR